ncbi:hypothetical protein MYK68_12815 [Gordonia sp. PP30]|uniref:hypothetical protein n=1 Tax=Gordonia sp. PP30 TaxID=2935861 RepID=UPI001FFE8B2E|nr:hypothetical protein [Gordonia sp. PP30]UQE73630.1 hypothetical protein MYK68_12815 [Gordonia sp. PP30]
MGTTDTESERSFIQKHFPANRSGVGWRIAVLTMFLLLAVALFGSDWNRYAIIAPLVAGYLIAIVRTLRRPS